MTNMHPADEDLLLVYYNEPALDPAVRAHVGECAECSRKLSEWKRVLDACDDYDAPARPGSYEIATWAKLRPHIVKPQSRTRWWVWSPAIATVVAIAFLGGMFVEKWKHQPNPSRSDVVATATTPKARERVLLVALGNHLDRSQMVLAELVNTPSQKSTDISAAQQRAEDLVSESRLLRQTAMHTGDTADANLLSDLERVLLEIANSPSRISSPELHEIQQRIEDQGLLFKVRIIETNLQKKEKTL